MKNDESVCWERKEQTKMAVIRVEKNSNYTVMANHHLRDKRISLKAKGLLSVMLSLPEEWDYTLAGLACISKEGVSAIRAAVQELEECGYVTRSRLRNEAGQLGDTEYTIYESPRTETDDCQQLCSKKPSAAQGVESRSAASSPVCSLPTFDDPMLENPTLGFLALEKPIVENCMQTSIDQLRTYPEITEILDTVTSNPYHSSIHPSILNGEKQNRADEHKPFVSANECGDHSALSSQCGQGKTLTKQQLYLSKPLSIPNARRRLSYPELVQKIKEQIGYWDLIEGNDKDEIDSFLTIIVEVMSTKCEYFTISGMKYPLELVHQRYSQITCETIEYALECIHKCGSDIRNIKQYLIATLFNAPATYDSYYSAAVRRDFEFFRR